MEFGKFKDATSLLEGYNNLEKEFTKKCQQLALLTKELTERETELSCLGEGKENLGDNTEGELIKVENNAVADGAKSGDRSDVHLTILKTGNLTDLASKVVTGEPCEENSCENSRFSSAEWRREVSKFFKENSDMADYKADIAKILLLNKDLRDDKDCLVKAMKIVKESKSALLDGATSLGEDKDCNNETKTCPVNAESSDFADEPNCNSDAKLTMSSLGLPASEKTITHGNGENNLGFEDGEEKAEKAFGSDLEEYFSGLIKRKKESPNFVLGESKTFLTSKNKELKSLKEASEYLLKNYFN